MKGYFGKDVHDTITGLCWSKNHYDSRSALKMETNYDLTPNDNKAIATEIVSQIITELRKSFKKSFREIEFARVKDILADYFKKDHERPAHQGI